MYRKCELKFLIVIALFAIFSCKKDAADPVWSATINSPFQFEAVINGSIVTYAGFQLIYPVAKVDSLNRVKNFIFANGVGQDYQNSSISTLVIYKGTFQLPLDSIPTYSEMQEFMLNGINNYSDSAVNGIQVIYTDNKGIPWSTSYGSRKQMNESFKIISTKMERLGGRVIMP